MVKNPVDVCDTSLVLGLGYPQRRAPPSDHHRRGNPSPLEPSLTLGHPDDAYGSRKLTHDTQLARQQSSSLTTVSSFSKPVSEEAERASSRASDEEEEGSARKKLRLSKEQSAFLEERFKEHSTLNPKQKQGLANQLNLRPRQVEVWFQNRRARTKMKQNEVEVELLRRYWETLTDENRRLKKEMQELKGLKLAASPWFMQLPGATLAVCPTCERASGASDDSKAGTGKPQLFNPFTHSAAC